MNLKICKELYSKYSLLKAAYLFTDEYYIYLDADEKNYFVDIRPKESDCMEITEGDFMNELLAQTTREEILKKTSDIRTLVLGRAVASTIIEESEEQEDKPVADENGLFEDWFENEKNSEA